MKGWVPAIVQVHHAAHTIGFTGLQNAEYIFTGGGQGFFDENMLARVRCCDGDIRVGEVRRDNGHRVAIAFHEHLFIIVVYALNTFISRNALSLCTVCVADRYYIRKWMRFIDSRMVRPPGSSANQCHFYRLHFSTLTFDPLIHVVIHIMVAVILC